MLFALVATPAGAYSDDIGSSVLVNPDTVEVTWYTQEEFEKLYGNCAIAEPYVDYSDFLRKMAAYENNTSIADTEYDTGSQTRAYLGSYMASYLCVYVIDYYGSSAYKTQKQYYLGDCYFENNTPNPVNASYIQTYGTSCSASLSTAMSVSAEASAKVLAFASASVSTTVSLSASVSAGTTYGQSAGGSTTVNPGGKLLISAYMGGVSSSGSVLVDILNPNLGVMFYNEFLPVGDIVVNPTSISLVFDSV